MDNAIDVNHRNNAEQEFVVHVLLIIIHISCIHCMAFCGELFEEQASANINCCTSIHILMVWNISLLNLCRSRIILCNWTYFELLCIHHDSNKLVLGQKMSGKRDRITIMSDILEFIRDKN